MSLDCSIIRACGSTTTNTQDLRSITKPKMQEAQTQRPKYASWNWDHTREKYVFEYKVCKAIDSSSGLLIMLTVTKVGSGESTPMIWFVRISSNYGFV